MKTFLSGLPIHNFEILRIFLTTHRFYVKPNLMVQVSPKLSRNLAITETLTFDFGKFQPWKLSHEVRVAGKSSNFHTVQQEKNIYISILPWIFELLRAWQFFPQKHKYGRTRVPLTHPMLQQSSQFWHAQNYYGSP